MAGYAIPEVAGRHRLGRRAPERPQGPAGRGRRRHHGLRPGPHPRRRRLELDDPAPAITVRRDIITEGRARAAAAPARASATTPRSSSTATTTTGSPPRPSGCSRCTATSNVRLMNGGRKKWLAEGRELTTETPALAAGELPGRASPTPVAARPPRRGARRRRRRRRGARRRALARRVHRRDPGAAGPARRPRSAAATSPAREHPVGAGRQRGRHLQVRRRAARALRRQGHRRPTRT